MIRVISNYDSQSTCSICCFQIVVDLTTFTFESANILMYFTMMLYQSMDVPSWFFSVVRKGFFLMKYRHMMLTTFQNLDLEVCTFRLNSGERVSVHYLDVLN